MSILERLVDDTNLEYEINDLKESSKKLEEVISEFTRDFIEVKNKDIFYSKKSCIMDLQRDKRKI